MEETQVAGESVTITLTEDNYVTNVKMVKHIAVPIWNFGVCFVLGFSEKELIEFLRSDGPSLWADVIEREEGIFTDCYMKAARRSIVNEEGKQTHLTYIYIRDQFRFTDWEMCALAHECLHVMQFTLSDYINRSQEFEAEAYTHTYLMEQCLKQLREAYIPEEPVQPIVSDLTVKAEFNTDSNT